MEGLLVTLQIYRRAFVRAGSLALANWPVLGSMFVYGAILSAAGYAAIFLGIAGGFLLGFATAACCSSFLYLVEMMVRTNKVTWEDFRHSFGIYLWDIVGVLFALWIWRLATPVLLPLPQGPIIVLCVNILILVLFNAVPELIYLGHHSLVALLSESYRFIAENWIEWFPPNVVLLLVLDVLWRRSAEGLVLLIVQSAVTALFIYFAMVVRGLLFLELNGSTRRARRFRYRTGR